ncbi:MAG TPA: hypothetical protein VN627_00415 [Novosphingobium sp.]|nr:hypothetical protein [Novosphingobium sp.]
MANRPKRAAGAKPAADAPAKVVAPAGVASAEQAPPEQGEQARSGPADPLGPEGDLDAATIAVRSVGAKGRWRCGRHFTQEPTKIAGADLTDDEIGRLLADPELIVGLVKDAADPAADED